MYTDTCITGWTGSTQSKSRRYYTMYALLYSDYRSTAKRASRCNGNPLLWTYWKNPARLTYLLTYLHTYLLTPWSRDLLENLTGFQLVNKFPAFYGTRRFITALTSARHLSLSWASSIQSTPPHPTSWRSILILSSHLSLGLPSGLFPSGFPTKTLYTPLFSPIRAICPAHLILLDFTTRKILGEEYRSLSSSLFSFLHSLVTSLCMNCLFIGS